MLRFSRIVLALLVLAFAGCTSTPFVSNPQEDADLIRAAEHERLRALVDANMEVARRLHADDFQLINPRGGALSKAEYLGGVASGELNYLVWDPESPIEVRLYGQAAVIRYQSQLEIVVQGQKVPRQRYWHTDVYEKRDGRWQVVWSQATGIQQPSSSSPPVVPAR